MQDEAQKIIELNKKVDQLEAEKKNAIVGYSKKVEALKKEIDGLKSDNERLKKNRIWCISAAKFTFFSTLVMFTIFGLLTALFELNTESSVVMSVIVLGWSAMVVSFIYVFGRNDDTWR